MRLLILPVLAMVACTACVPFRVYDTPYVSGSVRETISLAPIAGASITVASLQKPSLVATATSDADGRFQTKETWHSIWLLPLPYDPIYPDAAVTVSAPGYKSLQTTFGKLQKADSQAGHTIRLDRDNS